MPKVSQVLKLLKEDGWVLLRNGSRHDLYHRPTKPNVIPLQRHGSQELAKGTLHSILKDAGLK